MDEFRRSGGIDHGHPRLAPNDVLGSDSHPPHHNQGIPTHPRDDIRPPVRDGIGVSRQDVVDRSRIRTPGGGPSGGAAEGESESQHVRPVSDVQAAHEPSLSHMQSMREQDGPSLSMGECAIIFRIVCFREFSLSSSSAAGRLASMSGLMGGDVRAGRR